ncbi:E3 ubiquitin-protein ligase MIB2 [Dendroctonus ponderosae]|uniref:E3 ubiquitin-protein ligase MIB2 n=1 Tax=Dendroctonus ponderosae TaxID=77166 RepID=UPI0020357992|nr:E3 ubiquitin-protein ligase MIB2 [Dendroctonus ponderosae]XP_048520509.1 E3 ubiquitin-protein ligase MIB2 [Dendroctonus ponderosae]KAH1024185.1 hypothetical protein HUJ05_003718 [Dendroctonus ponderosae]
MLAPGLRIVRGPDWSWDNQDGGEGHVGTVCEIGKAAIGEVGCPDKTVVVQWDSGSRTNYRVGYMGKYDLRVIDNAQIGVKHTNIVCDSCNSQGISGMRYKCLVCHDFDLCYICYHGNAHDASHRFKRFDTASSAGVELPTRQNARKCVLSGIFVDAKVVRGYNWEWGNQDGGDGKIGKVVDIRGWDTESARSVAKVHWFSGKTNVYRLSHKGICDIQYIEPSSGGNYYPDHLPILGQILELAAPKPSRPAPLLFGLGDKVQVCVTVEQLKGLQQGHGGWNPKMADYLEQIGTVHRITDKGDIRVQYEGCSNRWTLHPDSLQLVNSFNVGDIVTFITDIETVKELQKGHGDWIQVMENSLGKLGKVLKVYSDGDLRVKLDGHVWTLNPMCVKRVPGSAAELANTMNANQRLEPTIQWHPEVHNAASGASASTSADSLVLAAAQGHLDAIKLLLDGTSRDILDARSNGKTALQVASHQGHLSIVKHLLRAGANVNASDSDGDTCLHYAAFGNKPEILSLLLKAGANLNAVNRCGCTCLHVAAHKQPAECAQLLLAAGADPNILDMYGDTALHDAIGKDSLQIIELICTTPGVDFTLRNKRGFNVLHHAALKGKNAATKQLLHHARQLVDVKKDDGFSALHLAALNGHKDVVETLIKTGKAEIDLRNNRNQTALLLAVSQGHCDVIELLVSLKADIHATDEDGDNALLIALLKRSQLEGEVTESSPAINLIYQNTKVHDPGRALAIACYFIEQGTNIEAANNKGQTAFNLVRDVYLQQLFSFYIPTTETNDTELAQVLCEIVSLSINPDRIGYGNNGTENNPVIEEQKTARKSRITALESSSTLQGNSPTHKGPLYQNEDVLTKNTECLVCSEETDENVTLEPCGHKPACEDCSARMKKCLVCGEFVQKRVTKDGHIIPGKSRQPSAERMKYLESKIAEIEESNACSICMERKRNVVFLCGHGTCHKCADTLKRCHMCRKTITKKIPIY